MRMIFLSSFLLNKQEYPILISEKPVYNTIQNNYICKNFIKKRQLKLIQVRNVKKQGQSCSFHKKRRRKQRNKIKFNQNICSKYNFYFFDTKCSVALQKDLSSILHTQSSFKKMFTTVITNVTKASVLNVKHPLSLSPLPILGFNLHHQF